MTSKELREIVPPDVEGWMKEDGIVAAYRASKEKR